MMKKKEDKWTANMRQQMLNYREPAPEHLWEQLESELATPRVVLMYRRRAWQAAAAVAVLLLTSVTAWWMIGPGTGVSDEVSRRLADIETPIPIIKGKEKSCLEVSMAQTDSPAAQSTSPTEASSVLPSVQPVALLAEAQLPTETIAEGDTLIHTVAVEPPLPADTVAPHRTTSTERPRARSGHALRSANDLLALSEPRKANHHKRMEIGLSLGNNPMSAGNSSSGYRDFLPRRTGYSLDPSGDNMTPTLSDESLGAGNFAYVQMLSRNLNDEVSSDVKHRMPVTLAATMRWHLNDRWSIETGLMYTKLSSELRSGSADDYLVSDQKLHYIGIPLKANYRLWASRRFSLYLSAGGAVEKSVAGKVNTRFMLNGRETTTEHHDLDVNELQWSVTSALGIQFDLSKHVGLYVEPGANYYFNDGSEVETIRKEHPLHFNLQAGIRFSY